MPTPAWYTGTRLEQLGLTAAVTPVKLLAANVGANLPWAGKFIGNETGPTAHAPTSFDGEIGEFWIRAAEMPAEHVLAWHANHDDTRLFYGTSGENLPGDTNVRAPIAAPDLTTVVGDTNPLIDVLANDVEVGGATLTIESVTQPTPAGSGTVAIESGKIRYTQPAAKLQGEAFYTYTVVDQSPAKRSTAKCRLYRTPTVGPPPPTTFAFVPAAPTVSPNAPANTAVSTATLGTGTGTGAGEWVLGGTHAALFELSAVTGRSTIVEKKDAITATGSKTITLTYRNEPGQVADITVSLTVTVAVSAPTAITVNPTTLTIAGNAPDDTIVTKVSINGGTGTGAFTLSGASTGFHLVAVPGGLEPLSRNLQKNGNDVISSGSKAVTIHYVGDDVTLALAVTIVVTTGPAVAPTDILIGDSTPSVAANADAGTDITTLTLNNSATGATGAWTLLNTATPPAVPTYIKLSAASGSPVKIQKKTNTVINTGDFDYVATYTEPPSVVLNEPFTLNVTSAVSVPQLSGTLPPDLYPRNSVATMNALRGGTNNCGSILVFTGRADSWTEYVNGTKGGTYSTATDSVLGTKSPIKWALDNGIVPVVSLPLCPLLSPKIVHADITAGDYDDYYDDVMAKLDNVVDSTDEWVLRLAWEPTGYDEADYTTAAGAAAFGAAWSHIALRFKAHFPNMKTDWCNLKNSSFLLEAYPGSSAVDIIGVDYYDRNEVHTLNSDDPPNPDATPPTLGGFMYRWNNTAKTNPKGIYTWAAFARTKGKPLSVNEWGLWHKRNSTTCASNVNRDDAGGGDNAVYVQLMYDFFKANKDIIYSETYFQRCPNSLTYAPDNAANAKYATLWATHWKDA
jgi:hypothetical protein